MGEVVKLKPLRVVSPIIWEGRRAPERDWLIEGIVLKKTVSLFSGRGGIGKSLIMQQLMTACALGSEWLGMRVPAVRSFGLFAEDPHDEVWRRQEGISEHYRCRHGDLEDMNFMSVDEMDDPCLYRPTKAALAGEPTRLWNQVEHQVRESGSQLVVVDNVGAVFEGNENYKEHVRPFIGMLIRLARDIDGAIMLLQHPSMAGDASGSGESGSRMWRSTVRSQMILDYPKEAVDDDEPSDERIVRFGKNNYGRIRAPLRVEWKNGVFVPSTIAGQRGGRLDITALLELRAKIEIAVKRGMERGERYSLARGTIHAASLLLKDKEWNVYSWSEIANACEGMVKDGKLVIVSVGTGVREKKLVRPLGVSYPGEAGEEK